MDFELIKNILSLVAAAIPLVIAIVTLNITRRGSLSDPIDSSLLKVLRIKRQPVEGISTLQKFKFFVILILGIALAALYIAFILYFKVSEQKIYIIGLYIIAILTCLLIITNFTYFIFRYRNKTYRTYSLYKSIDIQVEAEYHYVFNKCHECLKNLKFKIVEVDEQAGNLVAFYVTIFGLIREINIKIVKIENSIESRMTYKILLDCKGRMIDYLEKSKVFNRFIDCFIIKPKNVDNKVKD